MIYGNKIMIFYLMNLGLLSTPNNCVCDIWFKRLTSPADVVGTFAEKQPTISGIGVGMVKDSVGPYGDIFISLVVNDKDSILCSKVVKGDSTLLPKVTTHLNKQTVTSAIVNGRKVFALLN
jgi:hypothetical protein